MTTSKTKDGSNLVKVLLENERVRIYELELKPRQPTVMHSHPEYVGYMLSDAKLRVKYASGVSEDRDYTTGQAAYRAAQEHTIENVGDAMARILMVEIKGK